MALSIHQIMARSETQVFISAQSQTTEVPNNARTDNILYSSIYKFSVTKP